jgi:hypothetical protein
LTGLQPRIACIAVPCLFQSCVPTGILPGNRKIQPGITSGIPRDNVSIFFLSRENGGVLPYFKIEVEDRKEAFS